jgi:hypothetical protein
VDVGGEGSGFVISLIGIARDDGTPPPSVYIAMQNAIKNARGYARGYARTQLTPFLPQFARHKCFSVLQEPVDPFVHLRCRVRPPFPFLSFPPFITDMP